MKTTTKDDESLRRVIQESPRMSAEEYMKKYSRESDIMGLYYKVGVYDVLSITVYEKKELSRENVRVSEEGFISFPLIGPISVENLTTADIEKLISDKLTEGQHLMIAHVSVMVNEYNSKQFQVLGTIKKPGTFLLKAQERVLDAIFRAGGFDLEAQGSLRAMIIRTVNQNTPSEKQDVIEINLQGLMEGNNPVSNLLLMDKDILYIPMTKHFYITGQVNKPGSYFIPGRDIDILKAIDMAGGFNLNADRNRTRIYRLENGIQKIIEVKVSAITNARDKEKVFVIQPFDLVVVP
ncbi:polysaccharide export protein [bacterium]|nr:polysaccharide export protein [bacterium]